MTHCTDGEPVLWYVIHTKPRQEDRADANLQAWRVETFAPRVKEPFRGPGPARTYISRPLFPGYIFAHFQARESLHKIQSTRGVQSVVCFGDLPTPVDDAVIALIRSRIGEDEFVRLDQTFTRGDAVIINDGPLKSLSGIFDRAIKGTDRVVILLAALGRERCPVVIEQEALRSHRRAATAGDCRLSMARAAGR